MLWFEVYLSNRTKGNKNQAGLRIFKPKTSFTPNHLHFSKYLLDSSCLIVTGETVPEGERMTNAKDNRNSQVFESLALLAPTLPAVSDKERKKFEDEKSKLYMQLDEKVGIVCSRH